MGEPSYTVGQELTIRKDKDITAFSEWLDKHSSNYAKKISADDKDIEVDFDDLKIIQYWYDDFLDFLDELALWVDGYVTLNSDGWDEYAEIMFEEGIATIKLQINTAFENNTTDSLRRLRKSKP